MTDSLIPPNTGKTLTMKAFKTAEALPAQFRQHGGVFGVVTAGVLASLFAGFMLVCAIAGMAEAINKTAIIDFLIGFSFFDW